MMLLGPLRFTSANFLTVTRKAYPAYGYKLIRVRGQANLDPKNFGVERNFSIFIWLVSWDGKFILALSIFPT